MKTLGILFQFLWKLFLIGVYGISKGTELILQVFNKLFKALLEK